MQITVDNNLVIAIFSTCRWNTSVRKIRDEDIRDQKNSFAVMQDRGTEGQRAVAVRLKEGHEYCSVLLFPQQEKF